MNGEQLTLLQEGHHASQPALPESETAQKTTVGSGRRLLESWGSLSRVGASSRTLLEYLVYKGGFHSSMCFLHWKIKITKCQRLLFQLAVSVPHTEEIEYGLLLTPSTIQIEPGEDRFEKRTAFRESIGRHWVPGCLQEQLSMLPTPTDSMATMQDLVQAKFHSSKRPDYQDAILPPPTTRAWKSTKCSEETFQKNSRPLSDTLGLNTGMKLYPEFVEY